MTGHWQAAAVIMQRVLACLAGLTGLAAMSIVALTALATGLLLVGLRVPIIGPLRARRG